MITELNSHAIIKEYITCAKIFKAQIKKYGYTREAITEALRVCKDKAVLKEYLESRETGVTDMMGFLFDQETVTRNCANALAKDSKNEGIQIGYEKAAAKIEQLRAKAAAENKLLREEIARLKTSIGQS